MDRRTTQRALVERPNAGDGGVRGASTPQNKTAAGIPRGRVAYALLLAVIRLWSPGIDPRVA